MNIHFQFHFSSSCSFCSFCFDIFIQLTSAEQLHYSILYIYFITILISLAKISKMKNMYTGVKKGLIPLVFILKAEIHSFFA